MVYLISYLLFNNALTMLSNYLTNIIINLPLINQSDVVTVLVIVVVFFSVLLLLGIRKSYKLKKENEKLDQMSEQIAKEEEKYTDFTEGHMYGRNKK
jgi:O-antigen/teichoic acid export membrane protein